MRELAASNEASFDSKLGECMAHFNEVGEGGGRVRGDAQCDGSEDGISDPQHPPPSPPREWLLQACLLRWES